MRIFKSILILLITTNFCLAADLDSLKYFRKSIEEIQAGFAYADGIASLQGTTGTFSQEQVNKVIEIMENAVTLEIPNKVDYESGKNCGDIYD